MTGLSGWARRQLSPTPVGALWRRGRRHLRDRSGRSQPAPETGARPAPPAAPAQATQDDIPPPEPYPLDPAIFTVDPDERRAAAILDGAFGHGYLVTTGSGAPQLPGFLADWVSTTVGPVQLRTAPRTVVTLAEHGAARVAVLGHPVDVDRARTDRQLIAGWLAELLATQGHSATVREAAYLAGRWTLLLITDQLTVLPDAMGSQPVFWAEGQAQVALGSTDTLVGLALQLPVDPAGQQLIAEARRLRRTGVSYLPGQVSHILGVRQVVPNCLLTVDLVARPSVQHTRFWPLTDRVEEADLAAVHEEFRDRLQRQLRLLPALGPTAWSLTGGLDSRVLLAHLDLPPAPGTFGFTYFNPRDGVTSPGAARDVFVANEVASRIGMRHRVLRWRRAGDDTDFGRLHRATHPVAMVSHGAAHAMWADLPHDIYEIPGLGGEIGTTFGRVRYQGPLGPEKAATMWLGSTVARLPGLVPIFEDYLEHAQMDTGRLRGYADEDIFYWEHRMGRWGWTKFLAGDLSHRVLPPFNDRRLLEVMLRLPLEQRTGKALYDRVLHAAPWLRVADD